MIRFSAALVAVAIGVLIGGIATSKLLLVYIAIVVSAVALLALAIGVVVKREELFGERQGLVPARADADPVRPARAGESQDQHRVAADQHGPAASVPPAAPLQGPSAGHGAAFGETAQVASPAAASPQSAANPPASYQVPDGHGAPNGHGRNRAGEAGELVPPWEAQSARDQWSSSARQGSTATGPAPDWMPSGRGTSDPVGQAGTTAPSPPSTVPPAPSGPASAGPGFASPNWFAPKTRSADAAPPATKTPAEAPATAASADEDDNWPTRYAWLDDEADDTPAGEVLAGEGLAGDDLPVGNASAGAALAGETKSAETAASVATGPGLEPGPEAETEPEPGPAEQAAGAADGDSPSAGQAGLASAASAAAIVAVLPGVPRYHQPDCVLIRFMPDVDIQRLPAAQAKADGCTPCAACQPVD